MKSNQFLRIILGFIISFLFNFNTYSQEQNTNSTISYDEKVEIIKLTCDCLDKAYIHPEKVVSIKEALLKKAEEGDYNKLNTPKEFASQLDLDLLEITNDKHIGLGYDPKEAAEWASTPKGTYVTPSEVERYRKMNYGFNELKILNGNTGYLDLREFASLNYAGETAVSSMGFLSSCDAIIIDLRYNGGGFGETGDFILSYFLDTADSVIVFSTWYSRYSNTYEQSKTFQYVPGKKMYDMPLYVLTSKSTFSAAEGFAFDVNRLHRATIVGENTRGGENPISIQVVKNEYLVYVPSLVLLSSISNKKTRWEGIGVKPDIETNAEEALSTAHIEALKMLSNKTEDKNQKFTYQWAIDRVKAESNPVRVEPKILETYVGTYRNYEISYVDGSLYYRRGDRAKMKMIPMSKNLFMIEKSDYLRIRFIEENNQVNSIEILVEDGRVIKYSRK